MELLEKVVKRGDKWCVVHCHGSDAGKPIKCFDTEAEAQAMHAAMQAKKHEAYVRHPDFEKIYKQFLTVEDGENRYHRWIQDLKLDETKSYYANAGPKEKFQWVRKHADFRLWKQDKDAKYWRVEAGFPVESMNLNVYTNEELKRAARTIKAKSVNINHNTFLPTIQILAGEEENGVVECILRVPNGAVCPKGKLINSLLEQNEIVNVSLEAICDYGQDARGKCEGLNFTGLALLTKDVLPGIPLTRLMPLECIMVEALQVDETNRKEKRKVEKVKMQIKEQDERPPKDWWDSCTSKAASFASDPEKFCGWLYHHGEEDPKFSKLKHAFGEKVNVLEETIEEAKQLFEADEPGKRDLTPTVVMPDEHGQCPEGMIFNSELGQCVKTEDCPEGEHFDQKVQKCVPNTQEDSVESETEVGKSVELLSERVKRFEAQDENKSLNVKVETWKQRYAELDTKYNQSLGTAIEQMKTIERLEKQIDALNVKKVEDEVKLKDWQRRVEDLTISRDDYHQQLEKLKGIHEELSKKYHTTLSTNLELSRKLTEANEDYLKVAQGKDKLEEDLSKAKVMAKKIVRIKA